MIITTTCPFCKEKLSITNLSKFSFYDCLNTNCDNMFGLTYNLNTQKLAYYELFIIRDNIKYYLISSKEANKSTVRLTTLFNENIKYNQFIIMYYLELNLINTYDYMLNFIDRIIKMKTFL